ncbi:MAG: hypothetical protein MJY68_01205 [Bacteroidaceae bacterium]|nr:hypothetical protein [Bacteroidaceae bacterium]
MCTVNIKVDDATMRRINPNLTNREMINKWLQQKVDAMIESYSNDAATPPLSYERSEMMAVCDQRMDDIISGRSSTIPNEEG